MPKVKTDNKKTRRTKSKSNTKDTWEEFLKHKDSKKVLKESFKAKNPQKEFGKIVRKLHKKYSNKKK